jgi:hypothetical protein
VRRLRDCEGIAELERAAVMDPAFRALSVINLDDRFDKTSRLLFGVTRSATLFKYRDDLDSYRAEEKQRRAWDAHENRYEFEYCSDRELVAYFAKRAWDVTDDEGRPLYVLRHFSRQLGCALSGGKAKVPPVGLSVEGWEERMEAAARRFRPSAPRKTPPVAFPRKREHRRGA